MSWASLGHAQIGEVMSEEEAGDDAVGSDEVRARNARFEDDAPAEQEAEEEEANESEPADDGARGSGTIGGRGIQVGGHLLVSYFTLPSRPELGAGFGFQGRVATPIWSDIVGEANVGIMFNPDNASNTYKTAFLRAGARLPFDLDADPVSFFVGAGAALDVMWVSTLDVTSGRELDKSALTLGLDLLLGASLAINDRLAVEAIVQGTYALSTVVLTSDSSWFSLLAGVSYNL